jgi:4-hydroxy-tetrahydrodipicolinate synthase
MAGDYGRALTYQDRLMPLHRALFIEPNPTGVKYALSVIGKIRDDVRLPLVKVTESTRKEIRDAMVHAGLIN